MKKNKKIMNSDAIKLIDVLVLIFHKLYASFCPKDCRINLSDFFTDFAHTIADSNK